MSRRHATPIVFLDFETTGGVAAQDRIIEIGLVRVEESKAVKWETLVNPGVNIPAIVTTITGLTEKSLLGAPEFCEVASTLAGYIRGATVGR